MTAESTKELIGRGVPRPRSPQWWRARTPPPRRLPSPKSAIVTGASRGLGRGVAAILAKEAGFTVYAVGRTTADLEKLQAERADGVGKVSCPVHAGPERRRRREGIRGEGGQGRRAGQLRLRGPRRDEALADALHSSAKSSTSASWSNMTTICPGCAGPMPCRSSWRRRMVEAKNGLIVNIILGGRPFFYFCGAVRRDARGARPPGRGRGHGTEGHGRDLRDLWPGGRGHGTDGPSPAARRPRSRAGAVVDPPRRVVRRGRKERQDPLTSELGDEYGFVDATGNTMPGGRQGTPGVEAQAFFRNLGKTPPLAGGALGDHTQTNNELLPTGMKAVFPGSSLVEASTTGHGLGRRSREEPPVFSVSRAAAAGPWRGRRSRVAETRSGGDEGR